MARRGYGGASTYSGRRPRTKIYDSNYSMGEAAYRSALDDLDRKQFGRVRREDPPPTPPAEERVSPARKPRPFSMADIESNWDGPGPAPRFEEATETGPSMDELLERIKAARSRTIGNEQSFDSAFTLRREDVKKRFAEKMLDTVGINGEVEERRPARHPVSRTAYRPPVALINADVLVDDPKWPALTEVGESAAELAARARARQSRARLADLESEMVDIEQRGIARDRRAAAVRSLLSSSNEQSTDSLRLSKKITITERTASAY